MRSVGYEVETNPLLQQAAPVGCSCQMLNDCRNQE
jgi:hypothetical protein